MTTAAQIQAAVAAARPRLPHLAADFADRAIMAGKSLAAVQADLLFQMSGGPQAAGRASMIAEARRQGLMGSEPVAEARNDDAALSFQPAPTGAAARAASLASMRAQARQAGLEPRR